VHAQFAIAVLWPVQFLKIYISQGSVVTRVEHGGILNINFIANFSQSVPVQEVENPMRIVKVINISLVYQFFSETVYIHQVNQ